MVTGEASDPYRSSALTLCSGPQKIFYLLHAKFPGRGRISYKHFLQLLMIGMSHDQGWAQNVRVRDRDHKSEYHLSRSNTKQK